MTDAGMPMSALVFWMPMSSRPPPVLKEAEFYIDFKNIIYPSVMDIYVLSQIPDI
jgi:hypothetical protein